MTERVAAGGRAADIMQAIADETLGLFDADASALFRLDVEESVVVGAAAAPGRNIFTVGARFPLEPEMLATRIRSSGTPLRHARYDEDPSDIGRRVQTLGHNVVVGAPVVVEGAMWGILSCAARGTERLPDGTEHELGRLAAMCTMAIAYAEQRAQRESQAAEQDALMRVARSALERDDEEAVLAAIAREAAMMLGGVAAELLRDEDGTFTVASTWSSGAPVEAAHPTDLEVADEVRRTGRAAHFGDTDATALPAERLLLGLPVGWAAPVRLGPRFWGVLLVAGERGVPLPPDPQARVTRFAELSGLVLANVEARRDLLAQLIETERFAALVELSEDFIGIANPDGTTAYLNPAGRRLVGLDSLEEARTKSIPDYLTPEGREYHETISAPETRATGAFRGENTMRHFKTGEPIPVSVSAFTIRHPLTGHVLGTALVQHDLRERKRAEAQLREHAEQLEQLAAARRTLLVEALESEDRLRRRIGDQLHDEVLQELYAAKLDLGAGDDPDAVARARVAVDAATRQLRAAVGDLHPAVSWTHGLEPRLRALLERAGDRAGVGHRLECTAQTHGRTDELVIGLARELIQNVVKHADATFITVAVRDEAGGIALEVGDDGRGMPPERPTEALRAGHIGLASARERVEALGGSLTIDSRPGAGTRVAVVVPDLGEPSRG